jgi:hypothetical protein
MYILIIHFDILNVFTFRYYLVKNLVANVNPLDVNN